MSQLKKPQEFTRDLLISAVPVFDNPFLMKIVEAAPSPTAGDKHIKALGWSNNLAKKVRDAIRLIELYPNEWKKKVQTIKPFEVFQWGKFTYGLNVDTKLKKAYRIYFDDRSVLFPVNPSFLMDVSAANNVNQPIRILDYNLESIYNLEPPEIRSAINEELGYAINDRNEDRPDSVFSIKNEKNNGGQKIDIQHFYASVMESGVEGAIKKPFPEIYKVTRILVTSDDYKRKDVWTFYLRVDRFGQLHGKFKYERIIPVNEVYDVITFVPFVMFQEENGLHFTPEIARIKNYKPVSIIQKKDASSCRDYMRYYDCSVGNCNELLSYSANCLSELRRWLTELKSNKKTLLKDLMPDFYSVRDFRNNDDMVSFVLQNNPY